MKQTIAELEQVELQLGAKLIEREKALLAQQKATADELAEIRRALRRIGRERLRKAGVGKRRPSKRPQRGSRR